MNRQQFDQLVRSTVEHTAELMIRKGAEYADDADRLVNFKRNAAKQGTTPLQIWKQYIGKHIDSIDSYFKRVNEEAIRLALMDVLNDQNADLPPSGEAFIALVNDHLPNAVFNVSSKLSEPIEGRFHDIINYCFLGLALLDEIADEAPE